MSTLDPSLQLVLALSEDLVIVLEALENEVFCVELDDFLASRAGLSVQAELVLD